MITGGCFATNLQGTIRRWKLAATSCQCTADNHHVILPLWETDQWSCLGCQRPANLPRDPAWGTKACTRPWTQPIDMQPIRNAITFLELLLNKLRFRTFTGQLLADFTPDPLQLILQLEQQVSLLTPIAFAQYVDLPANHPRLPTKKKELLLRWALIQQSWDTAAHTFVPYSITAFEGFCTSGLAAPRNFQSFLRTPCASHRMDRANDAIRLRMLQLHNNIRKAQLTAGGVNPPYKLSHCCEGHGFPFIWPFSLCLPRFWWNFTPPCPFSPKHFIAFKSCIPLTAQLFIVPNDPTHNPNADLLAVLHPALYIPAADLFLICTVYSLGAGRVFPLLSPSYYYVRTTFCSY